MPDLPLLSVRGAAVLEVQPELATLSVQVLAEDRKRAAALRRINERGEALDTLLQTFADAITRVSTQAIRARPVWKDDRAREHISGYQAVLVKDVTVEDFGALGELLAQLANLDAATVRGPRWSLRPNSAAHRQARVTAVGEAVRQARDYAAAVGSELAELVELADTGLLGDRGPSERAMYATAADFAGAPPELTFDIEPELQTVRASIEARFRITVPDLAGPLAQS